MLARSPSRSLPILLALCAVSCSTSRLKGPQITKVPSGFGLDLNASASRKVFPDLDVANQRGWFKMSGERHASVMVTEFSSRVMEADVLAARAALDERYGSETFRYGAIETLKIDGRPAWGWFERQASSRKYVAVVSYPDATFSIGFYSSMREHQDDAILRRHVRSFRRDPGSFARVAVPVLLFAVIVTIGRFGWRAYNSR